MQFAFDAVENLDRNTDTIKRGFETEIRRIKGDLTRWIEQNHTGSSGALKIALLEVAIERQLTVCDGEHAFEVIEGAYKKVMKKHRGTLQ
jgi:hypothetical protein